MVRERHLPSLFTDLLSRGIVTVSNIPNRAGAIGGWDGDFIRCGSDGEWGFGYSQDEVVWNLNSSSQHISLKNIPNPSVQPL